MLHRKRRSQRLLPGCQIWSLKQSPLKKRLSASPVISYIHAEGYASGELKHGPIALIDSHTPVIIFAPKDELFGKSVSNMQEVMARGGKVLLVTDKEGAEIASEGVWRTMIMPTCDPFVAPILYSAPAQLIAYHTAVEKGTDVDQPRNLAKSVTVE